ncbi:MAG: hypothetical protein R2711_15805 [Acidimicrobiales bacterium]
MAEVTPRTSTARRELLDRVLAHVAEQGLSDRSLRDLATAVGTSHRMLLYHFGSRGPGGRHRRGGGGRPARRARRARRPGGRAA